MDSGRILSQLGISPSNAIQMFYSQIVLKKGIDSIKAGKVYSADELLVSETAAAQISRIRKEVRLLDFMPARYALVEWEPWRSMKMHQFSGKAYSR